MSFLVVQRISYALTGDRTAPAMSEKHITITNKPHITGFCRISFHNGISCKQEIAFDDMTIAKTVSALADNGGNIINPKLLFTAGLYIAESCVVLARKQLSAIYRPGLRSRNRPQMRNLAAIAAEKRRLGANSECRGRGCE